MNDDGDLASPRSATITYAFLAVLLRLTSAQCGVFTLWYSRRAYERSRGEMITMLYEKTLNRKILGAKQKEDEQSSGENAPGESNGHANGHDNGNGEANAERQRGKDEEGEGFFQSMKTHAKSLFSRKKKSEKEDAKGAASMGKILNLMRYVGRFTPYEIC
jgi:hypothetical protein